MNAPHPPPAGWYPDPSGRAPFRYWDGQQWTEHTNQGTAPTPSVTPQAPAASAPGRDYLGTPTAFGPVGAAAAPVAAGGPLTSQSFMEDLKKIEGYALVVVGAVLFILFSFLTWAETEKTYANGTAETSSNGWDGDTAWLIRGWDVNFENLNNIEVGVKPDSGTDMVILLPLALIAAGLALAVRMGKPVQYGKEAVLGASVLLAALMIAEVMHINSAIDDAKDILEPNGIGLDGSVGFGMYLATVAAIAMAVGALRTFMASKKTVG